MIEEALKEIKRFYGYKRNRPYRCPNNYTPSTLDDKISASFLEYAHDSTKDKGEYTKAYTKFVNKSKAEQLDWYVNN